MLAVVGSDLARQSVSIHTELAQGLPVVMADRIQLQQVLLNLLLMNAAEEQPEGIWLTSTWSGVTCGAARVEHLVDGPRVVVAVQDAGVGLSGSDSGRLFEPFYTTKVNGLGMGLSISRSIIESHGGRLWATANSDHGATFHFALPFAR